MNQNRVLYKKLLYDPDNDFSWISGFDAGHLPLAVGAGVKAANMREYVEMAKTRRVTMGNYSPGSYPHMVAQQLNKLYGTQIEPVPYKGEAPMWADLASGQIDSALGSIAAMLPFMTSGKARPIAVPTTARSPRLPEVPTYYEQGFKEPVFVIQGWIGMLGPAKLPRDIVERISALNQEAAETPRIRTLAENFGLRARPWTAKEFEALNREVGPHWIALARELGVTLD
jgi:tripartite-type tricarboxylate transporter receptor subunit TctC